MRMRLTLIVHYKDGTIEEKEAKTLLTAVAFRAASDGSLTGDGPAEVEDWEYTTKRLMGEEDDAT